MVFQRVLRSLLQTIGGSQVSKQEFQPLSSLPPALGVHAGLAAGDTVWMCGDDEALGEWPPLTNWPPSEHEPQPLKLSTCDLSTGDGGGRFCQGLVRLRAGQQTRRAPRRTRSGCRAVGGRAAGTVWSRRLRTNSRRCIANC